MGWEFIILLFLLLLILIATQLLRTQDFPHSTMTLRSISEFNPQTGDLLFVAPCDFRLLMIRSFTASIWMHSAFIVRDKDQKIWVLEAAEYSKGAEGTREYKGFFFIPFEQWYRINRKSVIAYSRHRGPQIDIQKIKKFERDHRNIEVSGFSLRWINFLFKKPYTDAFPTTELTCNELIIRLLQHCDVICKLHSYDSYLPYELYHRQVPYCSGHNYDPPVELSISNFSEKRKSD